MIYGCNVATAPYRSLFSPYFDGQLDDPSLSFFTESPHGAFFVAVLEKHPDVVVGTAGCFEHSGQEMHFTKLAVDTKYRRLSNQLNI